MQEVRAIVEILKIFLRVRRPLKILARFPFNVKIGFRLMLILLGKTRVNRVLEGSQKASKKGVFWDPHFGTIWDDLGVDLHGKTRCFLHAHA